MAEENKEAKKDQVNKEPIKKESVNKEAETLKVEVEALKKKVAELERDNEEGLRSYGDLLRDYNNLRKESDNAIKSLNDIVGFNKPVDIVSVPVSENSIVPEIKSNGKPATRFIDGDGFVHDLVSMDCAKRLLTDIGSPIRRYLFGPMDEISNLKAIVGAYEQDIPAIRHVKQLRNGKFQMIPIKKA